VLSPLLNSLLFDYVHPPARSPDKLWFRVFPFGVRRPVSRDSTTCDVVRAPLEGLLEGQTEEDDGDEVEEGEGGTGLEMSKLCVRI
jgi:hypothetical protein